LANRACETLEVITASATTVPLTVDVEFAKDLDRFHTYVRHNNGICRYSHLAAHWKVYSLSS